MYREDSAECSDWKGERGWILLYIWYIWYILYISYILFILYISYLL